MTSASLIGYTLLCLSVGTPKTINFPFGTNEILMVKVPQYLGTLGYKLMNVLVTINALWHHFPFVTTGLRHLDCRY